MHENTFIKKATHGTTLSSKFSKSINFDSNEKVIIKRRVRWYSRNKLSARLCLLVLTAERIIVLKHYFFKPDIVVSVQFEDISEILLEEMPFLFASLLKQKVIKNYRYITIKPKKEVIGRIGLIRFYSFTHTGGTSRRWRMADISTNRIYKKCISLFQNKH